LRREIENYPHIKVCSAKNANYTQAEAIKILQKTVKSTLFLDYFNQNVRNYLIKSKKLAVALITNNVNTTKAASFFTSYLSLESIPQTIKTSWTMKKSPTSHLFLTTKSKTSTNPNSCF